MTQFRANDETFLKTEDPLENKVPDPNDYRPDFRLSSQPDCYPAEDKYPKGRAIAAAFWISYFTLHWLDILGVVPHCATTSGTVGYFLIFAALSTLMTIAYEETSKEKK